ncbi:glycosyltransferase 87 family protein [Streptomyces sp. DH37]|uniref:glycosyltransferase 87 family protein n=1 Tax=Streptomyces sp. DH37 TaxID=3040122 RepID=UPI002440F5A2|nr:glycosyltransferase 87 family protein [Streptomyces sp. DH37]MDG9700879.1 glycosyltransferase 87 family protein [Streptomyces sp. DH37]
MRLLVAAWAATRTVVLLCVFKVVAVPGPDVTSDVSVIYQGWYQVLRTGAFPPDDVTWQYPPAAALAVLSPALLPFLEYPAAFYVLVCAADAAAFALLLYASRRGSGRGRAGAWVWVAGVPLLGPTVYARYDLMVTAVAVAALLVLARSPRAAGALAALGALLKVWPALLLVGTPRGRVTRAAWGAAVAVALALTAAFAAAMPGALDFLTHQRDRGTEVESVGALVFHVARHFGWEGRVLLNYGSVEFLGPYVDLVSTAALLCTAAAFGWLLRWRLRAVEWTASTAADAAFAAVLLFTVTSRVISPQYMVWLVGLAAVCVTLRTGRQGLPALLVVVATGVTLLEFPLNFGSVVASDALGVTLLVVRNGLLVAAAVLACARLWRTTVTEPLRRAEAAGAEEGRAGSDGEGAASPERKDLIAR